MVCVPFGVCCGCLGRRGVVECGKKVKGDETMSKPVYPLLSRSEYLIQAYGECCRPGVAAKILGLAASTISNMTRDGRLRTVCAGKMVDMHSIAEYMDAPAQADFEARLRKRHNGKLPRYYVGPGVA